VDRSWMPSTTPTLADRYQILRYGYIATLPLLVSMRLTVLYNLLKPHTTPSTRYAGFFCVAMGLF
jgi:hypothetical protein